jgi:ribonuclease PH
MQNGLIKAHPLHSLCAAVSVGIHKGQAVLDLPYVEDSSAEVDMNVVMLQGHDGSEAKFVEVQGTAEGAAFSQTQLAELLALATSGLNEVFALQSKIIAVAPTSRPKK